MSDVLPDVTRTDVVDTAIAIGILAAAVVIAWLVGVVVPRLLRRMLDGADLLDAMIDGARRPALWLILAQGLFLALRYPGYMQDHIGLINRLWVAAVVAAVAIVVMRLSSQWFRWYQEQTESGQIPGRVEPRIIGLLRRATSIVIAVIAGLILLDVLGIEITPLIAGLGIGGLAVGLALQPALSSLFAGSSMMSDATIQVGDFVEVSGGPVGMVDHIGWRATRVRTFDNNIVLVPNSTLADSMLTNYSTDSSESDARVVLGVAYDEDLQQVEDVIVDELTQLRDEFEGAVHSYEPLFRYQEFGDSNIDILVKLRAITWLDALMLRHLMIKRIHARLGQEGITINYPARRLFLQGEDVSGLHDLFDGAGSRAAAEERLP